jgi:tRNA modification GTPase
VADIHDTIVALSSPPGPGMRAIVRLSGPEALPVTAAVLTTTEPLQKSRRAVYAGQIHLSGVNSPLPARAYVWPAPRTYTGQDLVEIHTLSCPPLVELLISQLLDRGARAARGGEFTLRAFLAGKLDLTRAEAVLGIIEAGNRDELRQALGQLAGGVGRPLQQLRDDLLDLLAEVEAGLDFAEEDIHFVTQKDLLARLACGLAQVTLVRRQLTERGIAGRAFRVVLAGRPNGGKTSLFNAMTGAAGLVSAEPGTTRDYLVRTLEIEGVAVELVDTAGWQEAIGTITAQAQALAQEQAASADLVLLCLEAGQPPNEHETALLARTGTPAVVAVATKCDLGGAEVGLPATSAVTGEGLNRLRCLLAEHARTHFRPALAPSLSRCRHHVEACLEHLQHAHAAVLYEEPPEVLALELRGVLDELGQLVGAVYTDDLLDRIFSRFCIGK